MFSSFIPPRQVMIGDAASFVGTTPRAIRHYHAIGVFPEPERGSDGRRRYGYDEIIRLLWIRKMADAGIALNDIRDAFADTAPAEADNDHDVADILERLEKILVAQEAELRRQRTAVQRMRTRGSRMGLLSDFVTNRLESLPEGSLRQADLAPCWSPSASWAHSARPSKPPDSSLWPRTKGCGRHPTALMPPKRRSTTRSLSTTPASRRWLPNGVPSNSPCTLSSRLPAWRRKTKRSSTRGMLCTRLPQTEARTVSATARAGGKGPEAQ